MVDNGTNYFTRRASQERKAAASCANDRIARIHLDLAEAYDRKAHVPPATPYAVRRRA